MLRRIFTILLFTSFLSWSNSDLVSNQGTEQTPALENQVSQPNSSIKTKETSSSILKEPLFWGTLISASVAITLALILLQDEPKTKRVNQSVSGG